MNEQQYLCPWCKSPLDVSPVRKNGVEYALLKCPNGTCYDKVDAIRNTPSQARVGIVGCTIDDAFKTLMTLYGGAPEGCFGMAR